MTEARRIALLSEALVERHGTRNPFELAEAEGIRLRFCPEFTTLKGMYKVILEQRFIFLNGHMKRREARQVLAHELGHDALHREMARDSVVQDHFLLDMRLRPEYEANLFAANLLVDSTAVKELLQSGKSLGEAARLLGFPEALLELKVTALQAMGEM